MKQFNGTAEVLVEGKVLARVQYTLWKTVDQIDTGRGMVDGLSSTTGSLLAVGQGNDLENGGTYIMRLGSGRELEFIITQKNINNWPNVRYEIKVNGDPEA